MMDFFNFEYFISINVMRTFYLIGMLIMPFVTWISLFWIVKKYAFLERIYHSNKKSLLLILLTWLIRKIKFFDKFFKEKVTWANFTTEQKLKFILLFITLLFMSELFWRLILEYLIAFMQMHEALTKVSI